jgi:hypothetical protein
MQVTILDYIVNKIIALSVTPKRGVNRWETHVRLGMSGFREFDAALYVVELGNLKLDLARCGTTLCPEVDS